MFQDKLKINVARITGPLAVKILQRFMNLNNLHAPVFFKRCIYTKLLLNFIVNIVNSAMSTFVIVIV